MRGQPIFSIFLSPQKSMNPVVLLIVLALTCFGVLSSNKTLAQDFNSTTAPDPPIDSSANLTNLTVIQGQVQKVDGETATIRTPDIKPVCQPNQACPQYIIIGATFAVDLTNTIYETADGRQSSEKLEPGESVIAAGIAGPLADSPKSVAGDRPLQAWVIELVAGTAVNQQ